MVLLVTVLLADVAQATFPGANGKIAFERGNETAEHDIYAINSDGTGEINLTHNGANNRQIAWSPDGSQIAFFSDGDGRDNYYDIHVARADGSGSPIRVSYTGNARQPAWSPDGRSIAFSDEFLYTVRPDGSGLRALTGTGRSGYPTWSPDGSKIAFAHTLGFGFVSGIYVVNPDGSGLRRLTDDLDQTNGIVSWSPDGSTIAYTSGRDPGCEDVSCLGIYLMNADGTNKRKLTDAFGLPTWAPDGSKLALPGLPRRRSPDLHDQRRWNGRDADHEQPEGQLRPGVVPGQQPARLQSLVNDLAGQRCLCHQQGRNR